MEGIETASIHPMNADLMGKGRVGERDVDFLHPKIGIFITDVGRKTGNFNVQPGDFFLSTLELECPVNCKASCRCRPGFHSNVLAGVTEEVKIRQEGIFDDLVPVEYLPRRY